MTDSNLRRIGAPWKLPKSKWVKCRVCKVSIPNPTQVCNGCSGFVVGNWADDMHTRIVFREILKPENEWEYILPVR
jgi:hypothetical protein